MRCSSGALLCIVVLLGLFCSLPLCLDRLASLAAADALQDGRSETGTFQTLLTTFRKWSTVDQLLNAKLVNAAATDPVHAGDPMIALAHLYPPLRYLPRTQFPSASHTSPTADFPSPLEISYFLARK